MLIGFDTFDWLYLSGSVFPSTPSSQIPSKPFKSLPRSYSNQPTNAHLSKDAPTRYSVLLLRLRHGVRIVIETNNYDSMHYHWDGKK